ncbi:hypothetical protein FRC01_003802, partial [Tulasnella sp. 417]
MQQEEQGSHPNVPPPVTDNYDPEVRPAFGYVDDFWKRYDELADRSDKEMVVNLNAGLFSAVNTAFISAAMPALLPNPLDRTNVLLELLVMRAENNTFALTEGSPFSPTTSSVRANCLLYASLCCSLVAAVGAMLAKEWLQSYSRTGQVGPLEEQARFRQQKYTAAQRWHLKPMILFLPNLLFLSVLLFFAGLIIFLSPINTTVETVVTAFFGVGVALSGGTVVAGAISPLCPYQTAISRGLRRIVRLAFWCCKELMGVLERAIKLPMVVQARERAGAAGREWKTKLSSILQVARTQSITSIDVVPVSRPSSPATAELGLAAGGNIEKVGNRTTARNHLFARPSKFIRERVVLPISFATQRLFGALNRKIGYASESIRTRRHEQHVINAQAVAWLFEMTSSWEDQLTAVKNICLIDPMACEELLQHPVIWPRLLALTVRAIRTWQNQKTGENRVVVEYFSVALYHLLLLHPLDHEKREQIKLMLPLEMFQSTVVSEKWLTNIGHILCGYDASMGGENMRTSSSSYYLWKVILHRWILEPGLDLEWRTATSPSSLKTEFDDDTLSLLGLLVSLQFRATATSRIEPQDEKSLLLSAAQAYTKYVTSLLLVRMTTSDMSSRSGNLNSSMTRALPILPRIIFPKDDGVVGRFNAVTIYTAFLRKIKLLANRKEISIALQESLYVSLPRLLAGFRSLKAFRVDLIYLSMETARTIQSLRNLLRDSRFKSEIWAKVSFSLEYMIAALSQDTNLASLGEMVGTFLLDFFREAVHSGQAVIIQPPEVGNDSQLIKYIISGLKDASQFNQGVWLTAIRVNARNWCQDRTRDMWMKSGLAKQLVSCLSHMSKDGAIWEVADIMMSLSRVSKIWKRKFLDEGAIDAIIN